MGDNFQKSEIQTQVDNEISLLDILCFLRGAYKSTLIAGVTGLAVALSYLAVIPKQYEAVAQIAMAQIGVTNSSSSSNNSLNPLGVNSEEPSLLVARLSMPTSFTPEVLSGCAMDESANSDVSLAKAIKVALPKGVANVVELKTFGKSPEQALTCAQTIFELIKVTQAQILAPYISEAKIKLEDDEARLIKAKDLIAKSDKTGQAVGAAYLSTRDEIRYLLDETTSLKNVVSSNQSRATKLIAPIYANPKPIAPDKRSVLASGLFSGLVLGLLLSLGRHMWIKFKADL